VRTGTIGLIADEVARYTAFMISVFATNAPGWKAHISMGRNIARNCNKLVTKFQGDLLWFQADDHVWDSDALQRLEAHNVDVVVPMILMRQKPFHPVIFDKLLDDGSYRIYEDPPPNELIEVEAAGTGGMLVSRDALDAVGPDPFEFGMLEKGEFLGEDLNFCRKLKAAGVKIHCDTSVWMGHLSTTAIWPDYNEEGGWAVRLDLNSGAK
jgi:GT2 family glycosyltransferase